MAKEKVFGRLKRPLYRKEIPLRENLIGAALALSLVSAGVWIVGQKNNYDPKSRDVALEWLKASPLKVYKKPIQRWGESATAGVESQDLGAFHASLLQAWSIARPLKRYNPENLYEKVNGQAEQYQRFGFTELQTISIQNAMGQSADILLYHQGSFSGSLGLYAEQRSVEHKVISQGALHYTPTSVGGFGMIGPYFFQILITGEAAQIEPARKHILKSLGKTDIGQDASLKAMDELLAAGASFGDLSYVPENVFQYGFANEFWFAKADANSDAQSFLHAEASPEEALELLGKFKKALVEDYTPVFEKQGISYYQHPYLKTFFAIAAQELWIRGVDDVPDLKTAQALMGKLLHINVETSSSETKEQAHESTEE